MKLKNLKMVFQPKWKKGTYILQLFNANQTRLLWKRTHTCTFIAKEEHHRPGFKVQKTDTFSSCRDYHIMLFAHSYICAEAFVDNFCFEL